jgi:hypothetical protein
MATQNFRYHLLETILVPSIINPIQKGLATLLRNAPPNPEVDYLTGRAKAFYFSKCEMGLW